MALDTAAKRFSIGNSLVVADGTIGAFDRATFSGFYLIEGVAVTAVNATSTLTVAASAASVPSVAGAATSTLTLAGAATSTSGASDG